LYSLISTHFFILTTNLHWAIYYLRLLLYLRSLWVESGLGACLLDDRIMKNPLTPNPYDN
jgi:hypothetical protein